jgi:hypothetical protein
VPEFERTARAYGGAAEIFPGRGHQLMTEPGWEAVADRVAAFASELARAG